MTGKFRSGTTAVALLMTMSMTATAAAQTAAPERPRVTGISCVGAPAGTCRRGDTATVTGSELSGATRVLFLGARGRRDNRFAAVSEATAGRLSVVVPRAARSGRLMIYGADRQRSRPGAPIKISGVAPKPGLPPAEVTLPPGKVFLDGPPALFSFRGSPGAQVVVELYNAATAQTVATWPATVGADGSGGSRWDGMLNGAEAPTGRYGFRLAGAATPRSADGAGEFDLLDHIFPIRGKHDLGQSETNNFGGARNHGGQDMFAKCGTPLVAARGGVVTRAAFQERAGNYVVITEDDGVSTVYMHMRKPAVVAARQRVLTGQRIGEVGETGRASGCHLHFELWTAPGWYQGGTAIDPLPELTRWDAAT